MFEKTLTDIVKGIRASKRDTGLYISQCLAEIKTELSSQDMYTKANALQKLTFLQMMGYSMSVASFCTIEVMSSAKFAHKRIGYLAAIQGFNSETDVILLTTNLLQKELRVAQGNTGMKGVYEAGLAINCISNIVTPDLARDLLPELSALLNHPQPHLRKKAILCLFKVFLMYPQGLRLTFSKLQKCLEDPEPAVVSSAVNVITELSITNPKNYLPLAPAFFNLISSSNNNWMLIKAVKLLGSLVPEEPRLARKLLEPLAEIVRKTKAKSLLYEACHTITLCLPYCRKNDGSMPAVVPEIVELCADTLYSYVKEADQNLKYLGLVGFGSLLQSHPRVISGAKYRGLILQCLSDEDVTIRSRALSLLPGLASRKNWHELIGQLVPHVRFARGNYKKELCQQILAVCRSEKYGLVSNFEWYLDAVLLEFSQLRGLESQAGLLQQQLQDVVLRVLPLRTYAVRRCVEVLLDQRRPGHGNSRGHGLFPEVLSSIGWIIGEYSDLICLADKDESGGPEMEFYLDDSSQGTYHAILQALLLPASINLPYPTQASLVQSSLKVFAASTSVTNVTDVELHSCVALLLKRLPLFCQSDDVEVADRAFTGLQLLESLGLAGENVSAVPVKNVTQNDLLNLNGGTETDKSSSLPVSSDASLGTKARGCGPVLNYLLKPSPMKPNGSKAQRKKNESLEVTIDLTVFDKYVDEEVNYRESSKISIGSVSFTQQKLARVEPAKRVMEGISSDAMAKSPQPTTSLSSASFQNSFTPSHQSAALTANEPSRKDDPFYLASGPSTEEKNLDGRNQFGMIQLGGDEGGDERRSKKKKKSKRSNGDASAYDPFSTFTDVQTTPTPPPGIYDSDDDDSDDAAVSNSRKPGKAATGLSKIDLTTPGDHAGILPDRTHHAVSDQPRESKSSSTKKSKKPKKKSKKRDGGAAPMGDLLDMAFGNDAKQAATAAPIENTQASSHSNPVNSAFDDLLSLGTALQETPSPAAAPVLSASQTSGSRPWQKASIKSGDWDNVLITYSTSKANSGVEVVLRVQNRRGSPVPNVTMNLKELGPVNVGSLAVGGTFESSKILISFPNLNQSLDIKGTISGALGSSTIKLSLPIACLFVPDHSISMDALAAELSNGIWYSHSAKIATTNLTGMAQFLNAAQIDGALAATSPGGSPVRCMAKVREGSIKMDIKTRDDGLGRSIASDLKKLQL